MASRAMRAMALAIIFAVLISTLQAKKAPKSPEKKLVEWVRKMGGKADVTVQEVSESGLRGVVAARDFKAGKAVTMLPKQLAVAVTGETYGAAEQAMVLLRWRAEMPEWWRQYKPYWTSLPAQGTVVRMGAFEDADLHLLQDEDLADQARIQRIWNEEVFNGTNTRLGYELKSLREETGLDLAFDEFNHWATVIASYAFSFPREEDGRQMRYLLPLLDMVNHATEPNAIVERNKRGDYVLRALRDIVAGEEVTHLYTRSLDRNDVSLFKSGFLQRHNPPRVCACDLPGGSLDGEFEGPAWDHGPSGALRWPGEARRLAAILIRFPTTAEQDAALLAGEELQDWRQRLFVEFRMLRKAALKYVIEQLADIEAEL